MLHSGGKRSTDVAIVGGGLAGLYVAHLLRAAGLECRVLEAKERAGGRILSLPSAVDGLSVDLGPTWFWPHQLRLRRLLDELGIEYFNQYTAGEAIYELASGQRQRAGASMGMQSLRVHGGMHRIVLALGVQIGPETVRLSHAVSSIERSSEHWQIKCAGQSIEFSARYLILALPPRVFARDFGAESWLPSNLLRLLRGVPTWMAAQAKFVATYDTAFWRTQALAGDAYSQTGPMVEIHDASATANAGYALFGFLGVPPEVRESISREKMEDLCRAQFERIFGVEARNIVNQYFIDWARDTEISTEADSDGIPEHPHMDLTPFRLQLEALRLGFAVTETATEEAGYIEGALQAAERAAIECVNTLGSVVSR